MTRERPPGGAAPSQPREGSPRGTTAEAARLLRAGGLVAFPTETVYGLGAEAEDVQAVGRIFEVKGRPLGHPLIVHLSSAEGLDRWADQVPDAARALAAAWWPGPLTLVLPRSSRVPDVVTGGRDTVGLRVPNHPVALDLLGELDRLAGGPAGVAAPSANRFGRVSPTTAEHVRVDLGDQVDLIVDGGPATVGVESTIVDLSGPAPSVLRLGGVTIDQLAQILGDRPELAPVWSGDAGGPRAPGMSAAHYAPAARVVLVDEVVPEVTAAVADRAAELEAEGHTVAVLAPMALDGLPAAVIELEPAGPAPDFARVLYDRLRQADRLGVDVLVVVPPPPGGLGDTVRDRLGRAARGSAR